MQDISSNSSWLIPLIGAWANATVVRQSIEAQRKGILAEIPGALTAVNFMADVPLDASGAAQEPHWTDLAASWCDESLFDIMAFDSYPNYLTATPVLGKRVGDKAAEAAAAVKACSPT